MKRFITFGSIEQFRSVVKAAKYVEPTPVLKAFGTEKIHGTNASVCYSEPDGFWVQSRNGIITPQNDNAECALYAEKNKEAWLGIIEMLSRVYGIDLKENIITVYYEWCGAGIQKKSCVSGIDKLAIIFKHFKVSPLSAPENPEEISNKWLETKGCRDEASRIFNVMDFPTYEIEIDFNRPDLAQNKMVELTENIETNSGIAKYFDKPENIGEGIVWSIQLESGSILRWKTKGEKHSNSKVTKLKKVDSAKEQAKVDFANYATPAWRLEQAWQSVFGIENEKMVPSQKSTGDFIRAVHADIIKEEMDVLKERGLTHKDVNALISKIAQQWFSKELDSIAFK